MMHTDNDLFEFHPVSYIEVQKVIMAFPSNKVPGYDKVPISLIKDCLEHILLTKSGIINHSFTHSIFPCAWKKGEVFPHLKDGDHEVPNNLSPNWKPEAPLDRNFQLASKQSHL